MDTKKLLGKRIKDLRKSAGLTQEKLAELIDIETGSLSGIESGRHYPSLPTLVKIANNLNIEINSLFKFASDVSTAEMKNCIIKNIDRLDDKTIAFIYKFFEDFS